MSDLLLTLNRTGRRKAKKWVLGGKTVAAMSPSTQVAALGPDGFTWGQGKNPVVDQYGKIIAFCQANGTLKPIVSNNDGATWVDPTLTNFQNANTGEVGIRCSLAYDSVNDRIHALFIYGVSTDAAVYYRRFSLVRDGSNNITGVTKDTNINLILELQDGAEPGCTSQHPVIFWLNDVPARTNGYLVCIWGINEDTGSAVSATVRGTMRVLSNTVADNTAANWTGLQGETTIVATSAQKPQVACTEIHYNNPGSYVAYNKYPSVERLANGDLMVLWATLGDGIYARRLVWDSTNKDWRSTMGAVKTGPKFVAAGTNAGYSLKYECVSDLRIDTVNNRAWFWFTRWGDNTNGDQACICYIDLATDTFASPTAVYSATAANCASNKFVVGDVLWDNERSALYHAYTDLNRKDVYIGVKGADLADHEAPTTHYTTLPFDIPIFLYRGTGKSDVVWLGRNFNAAARNASPTYTPPYAGIIGRFTPA